MSRHPTHPGQILREDVLLALQISPNELAMRFELSRLELDEILNQRAPIPPRRARLLGVVCGNGPKLWLHIQAAYDGGSNAL